MNAWLILSIAIVVEVIATLALKASDGFTRWLPSLIVVVGYGIAFYALSLSLKTLPVGIVYAVWAGAGIVLVSLFSWLFYQQVLSSVQWFGITLIVVGVVVLNLSNTPS
ncbi:MAG TPA: multidrug efflux SMR transporter [Thiotrichales bacterium]|nr:MAG: QacE family quaternary ammonium compound efflux SMR transporter [Thiotrichales bacterium 35-46-9]OYZ05049.1 MAG: QacE family quaternary ammonium compound efflux SMR transporter [Thiotrichales bacterium 16-46-22]OZA16842.1 MAG: QacE family quaternary ammonium compound efflux SMR transporter [Thiotrichales bacterium 17-46-47]OZA75409.1 MAG: QacE family quaternary ammonium compound efflux SMR transporter [Thiotrichales bacterium 39-47-5]HQR81377.1 multidrug efflux SMR transporter [Thiotric